MSTTPDSLLGFSSETADRIGDTTALAASFAAVSLAIFLVLPTFRHLVTRNEQPRYSDYMRIRSLFRGFTILGCASILFSSASILGIFGAHWPSELILLIQETCCVCGLILSMTAIVTVWADVSISIKVDD